MIESFGFDSEANMTALGVPMLFSIGSFDALQHGALKHATQTLQLNGMYFWASGDPYLRQWDRGFTMAPKDIGCSISHYLSFEDAFAKHFSSVLVLEDDAIIPESLGRFADQFHQGLGNIKATAWDLLYLGWNAADVNDAKVIEGWSNSGRLLKHSSEVNPGLSQ